MSIERVRDSEYLFIECVRCDDRVKLAKNKGASCWKSWYDSSWLSDFLFKHESCPVECIIMRWE